MPHKRLKKGAKDQDSIQETEFTYRENVKVCTEVHIYLLLLRRWVICYFRSVCPSFRHNASQPLQTYGASARGPTCHLPNSGLPVIYFLFYDSSLFSDITYINMANCCQTLQGYTY